MCAPSSRLSATSMPAMRYRLARETWEMRHALTVCRTNCRSNSEYSSPLRASMSITLGNARRVASSTVNPLIPRLYPCGSSRSSSRRLGTLSQSCLMFFVSVMTPLYLTEASETTGKCLHLQAFPHASACGLRLPARSRWSLVSTLRPYGPPLLSTLRPKGLRFQQVVSGRYGKFGNPPFRPRRFLRAEGSGRSGVWLKTTGGSVLRSEAEGRSVLTRRFKRRADKPAQPACWL